VQREGSKKKYNARRDEGIRGEKGREKVREIGRLVETKTKKNGGTEGKKTLPAMNAGQRRKRETLKDETIKPTAGAGEKKGGRFKQLDFWRRQKGRGPEEGKGLFPGDNENYSRSEKEKKKVK